MTTKTVWDSFKAEGESAVEKVKHIVHEGNVRRVRVTHDGRTVAEFPLTAGVVGTVLAPVLAAIGVLIALTKDCNIEVERTGDAPLKATASAPAPDEQAVDEQC
jgi:D-aminopeptidase